MKQIIMLSAVVLVILSACSNKNNMTPATSPETKDGSTAGYTPPAGVDTKVSASIKDIVDAYLKLKDALASDNAKDAAGAGGEIMKVLSKVDSVDMTPAQRKSYADLADDIKENAEHISENAGKIDHQREHFEMLSKDIYDLVKVFGGGRHLYQDFCPMYDKKGAAWISETKEIKNPYMGDKMSTCGEVKEELK